jgi:hypothetical protein
MSSPCPVCQLGNARQGAETDGSVHLLACPLALSAIAIRSNLTGLRLLYPTAQATEISLTPPLSHSAVCLLPNTCIPLDDAFAGNISGNWTLPRYALLANARSNRCWAQTPMIAPSPSNIRPRRDVDLLLTGRCLLPRSATLGSSNLSRSACLSLLHSLYHSGGATCFRLCTPPYPWGCRSACYMFAHPLYAWTCHIPSLAHQVFDARDDPMHH